MAGKTGLCPRFFCSVAGSEDDLDMLKATTPAPAAAASPRVAGETEASSLRGAAIVKIVAPRCIAIELDARVSRSKQKRVNSRELRLMLSKNDFSEAGRHKYSMRPAEVRSASYRNPLSAVPAP
jgi:hypothetical protein